MLLIVTFGHVAGLLWFESGVWIVACEGLMGREVCWVARVKKEEGEKMGFVFWGAWWFIR